jgi:hypothetical protein
MIGAEQITAEFVAQIDAQLATISDEEFQLRSRLEVLVGTVEGLRTVRARLLGEASIAVQQPQETAEKPVEQAAENAAPAEFAPTIEPRTGKMWRDEELALLREHFPAGGAPGVRQHLPHRSDHAIWTKAAELGLRQEVAAPDSLVKPRGPKGDAWTKEEDEAVRDLWPTARAACYLELSHRSLKAVDMRAYKLGLRAKGANRPTAAVQPFPKRNPPAPPAEPEHSPEFQAQLDRVRNGARIVEKPVIRKADPDMTLGGVAELAI